MSQNFSGNKSAYPDKLITGLSNCEADITKVNARKQSK